MERPFLAVIIPAFNEEERIGDSVRRIIAHLDGKPYPWEIVVVDDGSTDRTAGLVDEIAAENSRVRLLQIPHGGKGAAVKRGMLESKAEWRFLCDADLSMPPEQVDRFFGESGPLHDISIGSREAPGARRINEPVARHLVGGFFNRLTQLLLLGGLDDTQCGFKLFRGEVADDLFNKQVFPGFAFDVEVLYLARRTGYTIGEVAIDWYYHSGSKVTLAKGTAAFLDIFKIRLNALLGRYESPVS